LETRIIDGVALSRRVRATLRDRAARLTARTGQPGLAVIIVGDNPASKAYVRQKVMACADVGVRSSDDPCSRLRVVVSRYPPAIGGISATTSPSTSVVSMPLSRFALMPLTKTAVANPPSGVKTRR